MPLTLSIFALTAIGCGGGGACVPQSDQAFCADHGKDCDDYSGFDNCGASRTVSCGTCELPDTCGGSGAVNVCGSAGSNDGGASDAGASDAGASDGGVHVPVVVIRGTIMDNPDTVSGHPSTNAFDPIEGVPIECRASVPSLTRSTDMSIPGFMTAIYSGTGSHVICTGSSAPVVARVQDALDDATTRVTLRIDYMSAGSGYIARVQLGSQDAAEIFSVEAASQITALSLDASGYPVLAPFTGDGEVTWRRFENTTLTMTDYASGMGSIDSNAN